MTDRLNSRLDSLSYFCSLSLPGCPFSAALFSSEVALAASCPAPKSDASHLWVIAFFPFSLSISFNFAHLSLYLFFLPRSSYWDAASPPATLLQLLFYRICWVVPGMRQSIPSLSLRFSIKLGMHLSHQGKQVNTHFPPAYHHKYFFFSRESIQVFYSGIFLYVFGLVVLIGGEPDTVKLSYCILHCWQNLNMPTNYVTPAFSFL